MAARYAFRVIEAVEIEPARPADAEPIALLSRRRIERGLSWSWRPARIAQAIRDRETEVVVARTRGGLVGFAIAQFRFCERRAHLALLAVEETHQRHGIGGALFVWIDELAARGGVRELRLEVRDTNEPALAFYRGLGFRETGRLRGYYQGQEDAITMMRRPGIR